INVYWINLIASYKRINTAKFKVIQEMEVKIGITPFKREEEVITQEKHRHLSDIEKMLPITLISIHFLIIIMMTFFYTPKVQ
ncbi:RipA family octameric membrane protein, partial [Enterobacter asburiae]